MKTEQSNPDKIKGGRILRRLMAFARPYLPQFYLLIFITLFVAVLGPLRPKIIQQTIDVHVANGNYDMLLWMTLLLLGLVVLQAALEYAHTWLSGWLGQIVVKDIRVSLFKHLLGKRLKFYDNTPIGRLVTRVTSDMETINSIFSEGLAAIAADVLLIVVILGVMLYTDWRLTLVSLSMLPLLVISTYIFKEKVKVSFNEVRTAVGNLNTFLQEHITGMHVVQMFNAEDRELKKFYKYNAEHRDANIKSIWYYSIYFPVAELIGALGTGLLVWYGAGQALKGTVSPGVLIEFIMYIAMFFRPIRMIADRFNTLQMGIVSADRVLKLLDSEEDAEQNGMLKADALKGNIELKDVWFGYDPEKPVLKGISLHVPAGKTLAIVGPTGAGKTSIINLINKSYPIQKGEVLIDGINIDEYNTESLRSRIGIVLQDVFLFAGTVYENITLGDTTITKEKVMEAARMIGADRFIMQLGGLDYNVQERGATLSAGQRQLIAFIRIMVFNPAIIIMDEATAAIDTETEILIQQAIEKLMKGRTAVVIAHRLSTIRNAHEIVVVSAGEVAERGTHEQLIEKDGHYAQLHKMQYAS